NSWSAAECLAHLTLTGKAFVPVIQNAIAKAKASKPKRTPHIDPIGSAMRWFIEPPARMRTTTTPPFVPRAARPKFEAWAEFASVQSLLIYEAPEGDDVAFPAVRGVSVLDGRIHYT